MVTSDVASFPGLPCFYLAFAFTIMGKRLVKKNRLFRSHVYLWMQTEIKNEEGLGMRLCQMLSVVNITYKDFSGSYITVTRELPQGSGHAQWRVRSFCLQKVWHWSLDAWERWIWRGIIMHGVPDAWRSSLLVPLLLGNKCLQLYRLSEPATEDNLPPDTSGQSRDEVCKHREEICTHGKPCM